MWSREILQVFTLTEQAFLMLSYFSGRTVHCWSKCQEGWKYTLILTPELTNDFIPMQSTEFLSLDGRGYSSGVCYQTNFSRYCITEWCKRPTGSHSSYLMNVGLKSRSIKRDEFITSTNHNSDSLLLMDKCRVLGGTWLCWESSIWSLWAGRTVCGLPALQLLGTWIQAGLIAQVGMSNWDDGPFQKLILKENVPGRDYN